MELGFPGDTDELIARHIERLGATAAEHNATGVRRMEDGRFEEAIAEHLEMLALCEELCDREGEATALHNIAMAHEGLGNHEEMFEYMKRTLAIHEEIGDPSYEAQTLNQIGVALHDRSLYAEASEHLERALSIWKEIGGQDGETIVLNNLAATQQKRGQLDEALATYEQALALHEGLGESEAIASSLNNIGTIYRSQSRHDEALHYFELARKAAGPAWEATALANTASVHHARSRYPEALETYERALALCEEANDLQGQAAILNNIGSVHSAQGRFQEALEHFERALDSAREIGNREGEASTLNNIGGVSLSKGEYKPALVNQQRALAIHREIGDREGEAAALSSIGAAHAARGDFERGAACHLEALEISREIGNQEGEAGILGSLGGILQSEGHYEEALDHYEESLAITEKIGDRDGEAAALTGIGGIYRLQGKLEQALEYSGRALEIREQIGDREGEAGSLIQIGVVQEHGGRRSESLQFLEAALAICEEIGDRAGVASALISIGSLHAGQGLHTLALERLGRALEITLTIGDREGEALVLDQIGMLRHALNQDKQAVRYCVRALSVAEEIGDRQGATLIHGSLAHLYAHLARTAGSGPRKASLQRRDRAKAKKHFEAAVGVVEEMRGDIIGSEMRSQVFSGQADIYRAYAEFLVECGELETAFEQAQKGKARAFLDALRHARHRAETTVDPGITEREAEIWSEISTAERRLAALDSEIARLEKGLPPVGEGELSPGEAQQLIAERNEERADLRIRVESLGKKWSGLERELSRLNPNHLMLATPTALSVDEARQLLVGPESAVLEYLCSERTSLLFCITEGDFQVRRLPSAPDLEPKVRELRAGLLDAGLEAYPHGVELYETLIAPVADQLREKRELLICADGALSYLPFSILLTGDPGQTEPGRAAGESAASTSARTRSGRPVTDLSRIADEDRERARAMVDSVDWSESWADLPYLLRGIPPEAQPLTLRFSSTAQIAAYFREREAEREGYEAELLALAYPAVGIRSSDYLPNDAQAAVEAVEPELAEIPHTVPEAWEIAELLTTAGGSIPPEGKRPNVYEADGIDLLAETAATRARLLELASRPHRYLHFATHGLLDNRRPELSGLLLAGEQEGKVDYLQAHEVIRQSLACELATLSCCETALGPSMEGEGIVGLTRAFQQAGALSVCATLWKIPDRPTRELMRSFYRSLRGGMTPARALAEAQREAFGSHPREWAGFGVWG